MSREAILDRIAARLKKLLQNEVTKYNLEILSTSFENIEEHAYKYRIGIRGQEAEILSFSIDPRSEKETLLITYMRTQKIPFELDQYDAFFGLSQGEIEALGKIHPKVEISEDDLTRIYEEIATALTIVSERLYNDLRLEENNENKRLKIFYKQEEILMVLVQKSQKDEHLMCFPENETIIIKSWREKENFIQLMKSALVRVCTAKKVPIKPPRMLF